LNIQRAFSFRRMSGHARQRRAPGPRVVRAASARSARDRRSGVECATGGEIDSRQPWPRKDGRQEEERTRGGRKKAAEPRRTAVRAAGPRQANRGNRRGRPASPRGGAPKARIDDERAGERRTGSFRETLEDLAYRGRRRADGPARGASRRSRASLENAWTKARTTNGAEARRPAKSARTAKRRRPARAASST